MNNIESNFPYDIYFDIVQLLNYNDINRLKYCSKEWDKRMSDPYILKMNGHDVEFNIENCKDIVEFNVSSIDHVKLRSDQYTLTSSHRYFLMYDEVNKRIDVVDTNSLKTVANVQTTGNPSNFYTNGNVMVWTYIHKKKPSFNIASVQPRWKRIIDFLDLTGKMYTGYRTNNISINSMCISNRYLLYGLCDSVIIHDHKFNRTYRDVYFPNRRQCYFIGDTIMASINDSCDIYIYDLERYCQNPIFPVTHQLYTLHSINIGDGLIYKNSHKLGRYIIIYATTNNDDNMVFTVDLIKGKLVDSFNPIYKLISMTAGIYKGVLMIFLLHDPSMVYIRNVNRNEMIDSFHINRYTSAPVQNLFFNGSQMCINEFDRIVRVHLQ